MKYIAVVACVVMIPITFFAHHGTSISYDMTKTVTLKGIVTEFVWKNPHSYILFDVKDEKGNVLKWAAEGSSPGNWSRIGWTKTTLKPGDPITITVNPSKAGTNVGVITKVVLPDGRVMTRGNVTD
jgi:hypothetical protein